VPETGAWVLLAGLVLMGLAVPYYRWRVEHFRRLLRADALPGTYESRLRERSLEKAFLLAGVGLITALVGVFMLTR
jgi:hypothetical protein